jgi:integrase
MARQENLLAEPALKHAVNKAVRERRQARFSDGCGLTLVITPALTAKWVHRYSYRGRTPERTLGDYPKLGLADARAARNEDRLLIGKDQNPVDVFAAGQEKAVPTFSEFALQHFHRLAPPSDRKKPMHRTQWYRDMTEHVGHIGRLPIDDVRVTDIEEVVRRKWKGAVCPPRTGQLVQRIARVMDFRVALENPNADPSESAWVGTLLKRLKRRLGDDPHHVQNRPALPYDQAPAMFTKVKAEPAMSARVLEWIMLTGVRCQEAAGARWGEIDWIARTWTVPASRRKSHRNKGLAGKAFVVPLSLAMVQCLRRAALHRVTDLGPKDLIFPSYGRELTDPRGRRRRLGACANAVPYSCKAVLDQTYKFGDQGEISTHGFRTTILSWGVGMDHRGRPPFTLEVMDRVLSHAINAKDEKVSAALPSYLGATDPFLGRRKAVMREWSAYLTGRPFKAAPARPQAAPGLRLVA